MDAGKFRATDHSLNGQTLLAAVETLGWRADFVQRVLVEEPHGNQSNVRSNSRITSKIKQFMETMISDVESEAETIPDVFSVVDQGQILRLTREPDDKNVFSFQVLELTKPLAEAARNCIQDKAERLKQELTSHGIKRNTDMFPVSYTHLTLPTKA